MMNLEIVGFLRRLRDDLCPGGMVSLQVGGIGKLAETSFEETRITFIEDGIHQYVTLTDDEWHTPERLLDKIVEIIKQQRMEFTHEEEG